MERLIYEKSGDGQGVKQRSRCWRGAGDEEGDFAGLALFSLHGGLGKIACCGLNCLQRPFSFCPFPNLPLIYGW